MAAVEQFIDQGSPTGTVPDAPITGALGAALEVVLPPAIVTVVISPLMIFEVLAHTTLQSGMSIAAPAALLGLSILIMKLADRRRRRGEHVAVPQPL